MANTYIDYTGSDGTGTDGKDFPFNFEYIQDSHIKVKINGEDTTAFTLVATPVRLIRLDSTPASDATIKIYRDSRGNFDPLVNFVNGSVLNEADLDTAYLHNLYTSQEASEGQGGEQLTKKGLTHYDAENNKIINLFAPSVSTDAANKGYVDQTIDNAIALGGSPAIVSLGGYDVTSSNATLKQLSAWTADIETGDKSNTTVTATGSSESRSLADRFGDVVNVLDFGASGDYDANSNPTVDDTTAIQNAINYAITQRHKPVYFPAGTYRLTSTITINEGVKLLGCGSQGSTENFGTVLIIDHAGNGIHFAGNSANDFAGTGGGMMHFLIKKGQGSSSGAIGVLIDDGGAADENKRHGEMQFNDVFITGGRDALNALITWNNCFYVDGSPYTTPGSSGIRSIVCHKLRCASASETDKAVVLKKAVHFFAFALQIDLGGSLASPTGIWIEDCENVLMVGANINGRVRIPSGAIPLNGFVFHGRCSQFSNQNLNARGVFIGEVSGGLASTTNLSNNLNIYSNEPRLNSISVQHYDDPVVSKIYPVSELVTRIESQQASGEVHIIAKDSLGVEKSYFLQPGSFRPGNTNGLIDLGSTGNRWDDLWSNGTFNGSDKNIKQDIENLTEAEKRVAVKCKALIKKYRLKDAFLKKGEDARIHVGIIAQELQAAFESEGLDAFRYSMIGKDTWYQKTEEDGSIDTKDEPTDGYEEVTQMSVRYTELLAFIIAVM